MYILIAVLAFGILIADHELGHFLVAKACGVQVNEFAIGMGPAILKKQGKETLYALRLLPIGGYCAMEGEDEDSDNPRAFTSQPRWKKALILVAGAAMNFILGLVILLVLYAGSYGFVTNQVSEVVDGFKYAENGIQAGDIIYSVDGHRIYYSTDFSTYMSRTGDRKDIVVIRDGEKLTLKDYGLKPETYVVDGQEVTRYGLTFAVKQANAWDCIQYSCYTAFNFVRMVWMSLGDLVTGRAGLGDMSGVVGIVGIINDVGNSSPTAAAAAQDIAYLVAFIAVNLCVMNLLPLPALDGGRILFLLVDAAAEKVFHKRIDPKYEGYVHLAGMVALLGLMAVVMFNDVMRMIR